MLQGYVQGMKNTSNSYYMIAITFEDFVEVVLAYSASLQEGLPGCWHSVQITLPFTAQ
jgi:hypothetical protein